jgi:hypothetical protein
MKGIAARPLTSWMHMKGAIKVYANTPSPGPSYGSYPQNLGFWPSSGNPSHCPEPGSAGPSPGCPSCPTGAATLACRVHSTCAC